MIGRCSSFSSYRHSCSPALVNALRFCSSSAAANNTALASNAATSSNLTPREIATQQRAALARAAAEFGEKHDAQQRLQREQQQQPQDGRSDGNRAKSPVVVDHKSTAIAHEVYEERKQQGSFKVKRKAPWGAQQLRDAWSEDAMARHDKDSVGERIDREYRYHPEAFLRKHLIWVGWSIPVLMVLSGLSAYYYASGQAFWKAADFQTMLNIFRQLDTSPRSALYLPRTAEQLAKPYELEAGDGPRRRRVGAREEYDALVQQYKKLKAESDRIPTL